MEIDIFAYFSMTDHLHMNYDDKIDSSCCTRQTQTK